MEEIGGIQVIGYVENNVDEPVDTERFSGVTSVVHVNKKFADGLYRIENSVFLDIIFYFHRSEGYKLRTRVYTGEEKGVFAFRSPHRPGKIEVCTVQLLKREGSDLYVDGLDAINRTPVLDIKPSNRYFTEEERKIIEKKERE